MYVYVYVFVYVYNIDAMLRRKGDRNNFILGFRRDSICAPMLDRGTFSRGGWSVLFRPADCLLPYSLLGLIIIASNNTG